MNTLTLNVGNYTLSAFVDKHNGEDYVAVKPLCDALGIDRKR